MLLIWKISFRVQKSVNMPYACGLVWSDSERNLDIGISCLGPLRVYFNGEQAYRSNVIDEIKPDAKVKLNLDFRKGWNHSSSWMRKTPAGFGCLIGAEEAKVRILNVLAPFQGTKRASGLGFLGSGRRGCIRGSDVPGSASVRSAERTSLAAANRMERRGARHACL